MKWCILFFYLFFSLKKNIQWRLCTILTVFISSKMPSINALNTSKLSICFPGLNWLFLWLNKQTYIIHCISSTVYNLAVYQMLMLEKHITGSYLFWTVLSSLLGLIKVSFLSYGLLCFFNNSNNSLDKRPLELLVYNGNLRHQR